MRLAVYSIHLATAWSRTHSRLQVLNHLSELSGQLLFESARYSAGPNRGLRGDDTFRGQSFRKPPLSQNSESASGQRLLVSYKYPVKAPELSELIVPYDFESQGLEEWYDDVFGQLTAPYRILQELKDEKTYDNEGLEDEDHEANIILRNLVLSDVYSRVLQPGELPSFKLHGDGEWIQGFAGTTTDTMRKPLDSTYLLGLHMEVLETDTFGPDIEDLRFLLSNDPRVEDVWLDEVIEGQEWMGSGKDSRNQKLQSDETDDTDDSIPIIYGDDIIEDPVYEAYDQAAAFRQLPMVYPMKDTTYQSWSEMFIPQTSDRDDTTSASSSWSLTATSGRALNDKYYRHQWAHHHAKHGIFSEEGWREWTGEQTNFVVALIDSGVDIDHPDLRSQYWRNTGETDCFNGIDDDGNGYIDDCIGWDWIDQDNLPQDENGHGTASAGIIAAVPDNEIGIVGLCWGCKLMVLRTLDKDIRGTISGFIKAIDYALVHGAKLSNNSYGGRGSSYASLQTAVKRAKNGGMIFVAAAGNYGSNNDLTFAQPTYPASYNESNIISVAASDQKGSLAPFSCYGRKTVDLAAPGVGVLATTLNKKYAQVDGTSFATPFVTGVAALILSREPYIGYQEVVRRILSTVTVTPALQDRVKTGGILNMGEALALGVPSTNSAPSVCTATTCPSHSDCLVTNVGVRCKCHKGFRHSYGRCIAECTSDQDCAAHEYCGEAPRSGGRRLCECHLGFARDAEGLCYDQNECVHKDICPQEALCINKIGGFDCICPDGFVWNGVPWTAATCQPMRDDGPDIDELRDREPENPLNTFVLAEVRVKTVDCRVSGCPNGQSCQEVASNGFECISAFQHLVNASGPRLSSIPGNESGSLFSPSSVRGGNRQGRRPVNKKANNTFGNRT